MKILTTFLLFGVLSTVILATEPTVGGGGLDPFGDKIELPEPTDEPRPDGGAPSHGDR